MGGRATAIMPLLLGMLLAICGVSGSMLPDLDRETANLRTVGDKPGRHLQDNDVHASYYEAVPDVPAVFSEAMSQLKDGPAGSGSSTAAAARAVGAAQALSSKAASSETTTPSFTLSWDSATDLALAVLEPGDNLVFFGNPQGNFGSLGSQTPPGPGGTNTYTFYEKWSSPDSVGVWHFAVVYLGGEQSSFRVAGINADGEVIYENEFTFAGVDLTVEDSEFIGVATLTIEKDPLCPDGADICDDPHMQGLRGQRIDWFGVDGGWYSLIKDDAADLDINVRLTAPLPEEFPDRQLVTGLAVLSEGRSIVIEVVNPYEAATGGCPKAVSPCLANGGLRVVVDGAEVPELLQSSRLTPVADGAMSVSASNLPVECRQFGGDRIWARMYQEMLLGRRKLGVADDQSFEEWILSFDNMAAPDWCAKYIAEKDLADVQSDHAIFKIETPTVTVRLNAGVNFQGDGQQDWDGRILPDLDFWQMGVGLDGLDVENPVLSGILGETARPVYDENGIGVMEGFEAFRGDVEDYRVPNALGTHFAHLD